MTSVRTLNTLISENKGGNFLLIFGILFLCFALLCTGVYLYLYFNGQQARKRILYELNAESAIVIDLENKKVRLINFKKLDNTVIMEYSDFLQDFYEEDIKRFDKWVKNLATGQILADSEDTVKLFSFCTCSKTKKDFLKYTYRLMFCCTKINKEKKTLYLNTHFLYNLPIKDKKIFNKNSLGIYSIKEINQMYIQNTFRYGVMFFVKLYKKNNLPSSFNEYEIRYMLLNALCKKFKKLRTHSYYYVFSDNNPLELIAIRCKSNEIGINARSISTVGKITNYIKRQNVYIEYLLEVKGFAGFYDYVITASQISKLDKDFTKSVDMLDKLASIAKEDKLKYLVYKDEFGSSQNIEDSYKAELAKIIRLNLLTVNFLPIYRIANVRVMNPGYIAIVEPKQSLFKNMEEVKKVAIKYEQVKDLTSLIVRDVVPVFNDEKENLTAKLGLLLSVSQLEFMVRNFPHMNGTDDLNLILILNNDDLVFLENEKESENLKATFYNQIDVLKARGYEIYLKIEVGNYILREKTYQMFDGYFVVSNLPSTIKLQSRSVQDSYALYNKMLKLGKPVVSYRAQSWQEIELLVKRGVYSFATEILSEPSSVLLPIKKKVSKRLSDMYKK